MHATSIIERAERDAVVFHNDFRNERVIVFGHIATKSLVSRESPDVHITNNFYFLTADVKNVQEVLGVIELEPGRKVVCFFEPEQLERLGPLREGDRAFFECTFDAVYEYEGRTVARFRNCTVDS